MKIEKIIRITIGELCRSTRMVAELPDTASADMVNAVLQGMDTSEKAEWYPSSPEPCEGAFQD